MVSLWLHRVRRGFACEEGFELSRVYLEGMQRTQFSSVQSLSLTLCNPVDLITSDLPVHYHLPEFTQTHAH